LTVGLVAAAALLFAASAFALGELTQKPGEAGCISETGADGCAKGQGLGEAIEAAISPDGRNLYVAARDSNALAVFGRDPAAVLRELGCFSQPVVDGCIEARALKGARSVAVSPDGRTVYVASRVSNAVAVFERDPALGTLVQKGGEDGCVAEKGAEGCRNARAMTDVTRLAVSPDGGNVYVLGLGGQIAVLDRAADGALTQKGGKVGCISSTGGDGSGGECEPMRLPFASNLVFSDDAATAYLSGSSSNMLGIFDRDGAGNLSQRPGAAGCVSLTGTDGAGGECGTARAFGAPQAMTVSPDGESLYVSAFNSEALVVFDLDPAGQPTQVEGAAGCISVDGTDGAGGPCQPGRGLRGPQALAVSPDGQSLYLPSFNSDSLASFDRATDGSLTQKAGEAGCLSIPGDPGVCGDGVGLDGAAQAIVSPDGRNVYAISLEPGAITAFDRALPPSGEGGSAPEVTGFRFTPRRFAPKPAGKGARVRFELSKPASVRIALERLRPRAHGRPRFARAGALQRLNRPAGLNTLAFSGRIGGRALRPGRYRATLVATDAQGRRSAPRRASFTVLRKR
jgi:DNA-binding beta-propeller fold protein YncE